MTFVQQTLPLTSNRCEIKESGLHWLGRIPVNWHVHAVKRHYDIQLGKMLQNEPQSQEDREIPYAKALHVQWGRVIVDELPTMWASRVDIEKFGIRDGDLLVCEGGEGGRAGIVLNPPPDCIIQNALHRVRAKPTASLKYLQRVLSTVSSSGWFDVLCDKATIAHFTREKFAALMIPVPPRSEQDAIVAFLDRKLAEIDRFIALKRQLIDLLHEQRATLIHQAVTRGLDPNIEMKPSGVDWLPQIPKHWQMRRNGTLFDERKESGREDLPVLMVSLNTGVTEERDNSDRPPRLIEDREQYKFAARGDIAFNMMRMWQGAVGVVPTDGNVSPAYIVARPRKQTVARYYELLFRTKLYQGEVFRYSYGIVLDRNRLYWIGFKSIHSPFPPPEEQQAIVERIEELSAEIATAIAKANREIELIEEYRTALIAEAVTGKSDVRAMR